MSVLNSTEALAQTDANVTYQHGPFMLVWKVFAWMVLCPWILAPALEFLPMMLIGVPFLLITTGILAVDLRIAIAFVIVAVAFSTWAGFVPSTYAGTTKERPKRTFLEKTSRVVFMASLLGGFLWAMHELTSLGPVLRWFSSVGLADYFSAVAAGYFMVPDMIAQDRALGAIERRILLRQEVSAQHARVTDTCILKGMPASGGVVTARARVVSELIQAYLLEPGEVLVCPATTPASKPLFDLVSAVVTDRGGVTSFAAIDARAHGLPCVVGTRNATVQIPNGAIITVDGEEGTVRIET